ncbi:MAG: hypothetical protein AABW46_00530 [Nanoarchaeota archaeon]
MNKKAQVQFMEMIFVLLILVVIIFMGFIFYYSFLYKGLEEKGERFTEIDAIILTDSVASMAELTHDTGVINSIKIFSLVEHIDDDYYKDFFGDDKKVILEVVYPKPEGDVDCTSIDPNRHFDTNYHFNTNYRNNKCKSFTIYDAKSGIREQEIRQNPVSVYYPLTDEYKIGILRIGVYKNE